MSTSCASSTAGPAGSEGPQPLACPDARGTDNGALGASGAKGIGRADAAREEMARDPEAPAEPDVEQEALPGNLLAEPAVEQEALLQSMPTHLHCYTAWPIT